MKMTGNNIALSGLRFRGSFVTQGSACAPMVRKLHPGLRVLRPFGTKRTQPRSGGVLAAQGEASLRAEPWVSGSQLFFKPWKGGVNYIQKIVLKGGENVSVAMVRDFAHVDDRSSIEREQAAMGFFVTLAEPSMTDHAPGPMSKESVAFGFYHTPSPFQGEGRGGVGAEYPKLQILTIEGLMSGTERPRYPDLTLGRSTFKRAQIEDVSGEQGKLL